MNWQTHGGQYGIHTVLCDGDILLRVLYHKTLKPYPYRATVFGPKRDVGRPVWNMMKWSTLADAQTWAEQQYRHHMTPVEQA